MRVFFFLSFSFIDPGERGREREREGEKHQCERDIDRSPLPHTPTRDQTYIPGVCPDGASHSRSLGLQDDTQPTVPHQAGPEHGFFRGVG